MRKIFNICSEIRGMSIFFADFFSAGAVFFPGTARGIRNSGKRGFVGGKSPALILSTTCWIMASRFSTASAAGTTAASGAGRWRRSWRRGPRISGRGHRAETAVEQVFVDDHLRRIPGLARRPFAGGGLEIGEAVVLFDQVDDAFQQSRRCRELRAQFLFHHQGPDGGGDVAPGSASGTPARAPGFPGAAPARRSLPLPAASKASESGENGGDVVGGERRR